jgi:hypothetical protein
VHCAESSDIGRQAVLMTAGGNSDGDVGLQAAMETASGEQTTIGEG